MVNKILTACVVLVLLAMAAVVYLGFFNSSPTAIAKVQALSGSATVVRDSGADGLATDSLLYAADKVLVKNGRVTLIFADGTQMIMGDKTSIALDSYEYDEEANIVTGSFGFVKGAIRVVTGRLSLARNIRVASTSGTTIGIRGTDVFVGNLEPDVLDVLLIESKRGVAVSNKHGKVKLESAQGTTIRKGEAPTDAKFWPQAKVDKAIALVK